MKALKILHGMPVSHQLIKKIIKRLFYVIFCCYAFFLVILVFILLCNILSSPSWFLVLTAVQSDSQPGPSGPSVRGTLW